MPVARRCLNASIVLNMPKNESLFLNLKSLWRSFRSKIDYMREAGVFREMD